MPTIPLLRTGEAMSPWERRVTADPAANTEFTYTVPDGQFLELCAVTVQLVQGAGQTPWPILRLTDGTNIIYESYSASAAQAASTTAQHTWFVGSGRNSLGATTDVHGFGTLAAGLLLGPGYTVTSNTVGKGAATNYGIASIWVVQHK